MTTASHSHKIGFYSIILFGINGIIGSGIFLLPGQVMALARQESLLVYGFVALLVLAIAWSFAKCAALFTRNGGAYVYAREAFGPFVGFEIGLMRWAVGIIAWATMTVGFATALSTIWPPALQEPIRSFLIIGMIGGLGIINVLGVGWVKSLNNIVTVAKLLPLLGFILLGVFFLQADQFVPPNITDVKEVSFGAAALLIFYAFSGFENLSVAAAEMENPKKNLPLAILIVVGICSLIYILIQIISMSILQSNLAVSTTPIADAANVLLGPSGKWFVLGAMLVSIGGINIGSSFMVPRAGEALAVDGLLPKWIAYRSSLDTPVWAIFLSVIFTICVALFGTFAQLATISVIARFVQYTSTCLAAIVLGKEERRTQTPFRRAISVLIPIIGLTGIAWLLFQADFKQILWGCGALVVGIPIYYIQNNKGRELVEEQT